MFPVSPDYMILSLLRHIIGGQNSQLHGQNGQLHDQNNKTIRSNPNGQRSTHVGQQKDQQFTPVIFTVLYVFYIRIPTVRYSCHHNAQLPCISLTCLYHLHASAESERVVVIKRYVSDEEAG